MIRLAFLADGDSLHTRRWAKYFVDRGVDVHLVTSEARPIRGVTVHALHFPLARNNRFLAVVSFPLRVLKVKRLIGKLKPDIVHAHYVTNYGVCAALSGFHPFIISALGSDVTESHGLKKLLVKYVLGRADIVDGHVLRKLLVKLGCDSRKISPYAWGVDTEAFKPAVKRSEGFRVVCARYWQSIYNVETLVRAVPLVLEAVPNVRFVLLGGEASTLSGSVSGVGGGSSKNSLQELAKKLNVFDRIDWVGNVPEPEMPRYLAEATVCVDTFPRYVGIGQTTRQALACGTPCIIARAEGEKRMAFNCLLFDPSSPDDLAWKILFLLNSDEFRRGMGRDSRAYALQFFDGAKTMRMWENIYGNLVKKWHLTAI